MPGTGQAIRLHSLSGNPPDPKKPHIRPAGRIGCQTPTTAGDTGKSGWVAPQKVGGTDKSGWHRKRWVAPTKVGGTGEVGGTGKSGSSCQRKCDRLGKTCLAFWYGNHPGERMCNIFPPPGVRLSPSKCGRVDGVKFAWNKGNSARGGCPKYRSVSQIKPNPLPWNKLACKMKRSGNLAVHSPGLFFCPSLLSKLAVINQNGPRKFPLATPHDST